MSDPTPQQRADYLVRKLEQFIRDGKSDRGMSFRTWQSMARAELANSFADFERAVLKSRQDAVGKRLILLGATATVTIGFWGAVVALDRRFGDLAATICSVAGLFVAAVVVEMGLRRMSARYRTIARQKSFERIADFDRQLKQFEVDLWRKLQKTKEKADADEQAQ